jgi:hypothetical protein
VKTSKRFIFVTTASEGFTITEINVDYSRFFFFLGQKALFQTGIKIGISLGMNHRRRGRRALLYLHLFIRMDLNSPFLDFCN